MFRLITSILLNKLFLKDEHILLFLFLLLILIDFVPMILFHDYQNKLKKKQNYHFVYVYIDAGMIRDDTTVRATEATERDLLVVHTKGYLNNLKVSPRKSLTQLQIDRYFSKDLI